MSKGKLTRQELGWLITQEAQGAADRLRRGVQILKSNAPPAEVAETSAAVPAIPGTSPTGFGKSHSSFPPGVGLDATLDALDDAMKMLSSPHQKSGGARGRRGRIDLAALIYEISPEAKVSIEPGSGTEVFGDENEFRRMLQVIIGQSTGVGSAVTIRGNGEEVHVRVNLGPEGPGVSEVERAWLSRMTIRYGGRYEIEGGTEVLVLPADGVSEQKERQALRKELDEARAQGEAYARELAAVLTTEDVELSKPSTIPPPPFAASTDRHHNLAKLAGGIAGELRHILSPAARAAQSKDGNKESVEERWEVVRRALIRAQDLLNTLSSFAVPEDDPISVNFAETIRSCERALESRATRAEVTVELQLADDVRWHVRPQAFGAMVHELLLHAIDSSPRGSKVIVQLEKAERPKLIVDDSGAPIAGPSRRAFAELDVEPGTLGRPTGLPLFLAMETARALGAEFELGDAPTLGGLRVQISFAQKG